MRSSFDDFSNFGIFHKENVREHIDLHDLSLIESVIASEKPTHVVNCSGVTNHMNKSFDEMVFVNSFIPCFINKICHQNGSRYIQISTDCVFSGRLGHYSESDTPDATDLYGKSKALGETSDYESLIIRTSFIGREIFTKRGLLEWFLSQVGDICGYCNVFWSGLSSLELSRIILEMIKKDINGVYHVGGDKIDKYSLLCLFKKIFNKNVEIEPCYLPKSDKSLNIEKFKKLGMSCRSLPEMVEEIKNEH